MLLHFWNTHKKFSFPQNGTDQNSAQITEVTIHAKTLEYRQNNLDKDLDDAKRIKIPTQAFTSIIHL
jgi:hypothetical protein